MAVAVAVAVAVAAGITRQNPRYKLPTFLPIEMFKLIRLGKTSGQQVEHSARQ